MFSAILFSHSVVLTINDAQPLFFPVINKQALDNLDLVIVKRAVSCRIAGFVEKNLGM